MQSFPENAQISGGQKIQFSSTVSSRLCTGLFSFIMRNFSEMFLSPQSELEFSHGQDPKRSLSSVLLPMPNAGGVVTIQYRRKLFDDHPRAARLRWLGCCRRKREGRPDGETIRPVLRGKISIALEIDVALISFASREHEPDLRSNAKHTSFEIA